MAGKGTYSASVGKQGYNIDLTRQTQQAIAIGETEKARRLKEKEDALAQDRWQQEMNYKINALNADSQSKYLSAQEKLKKEQQAAQEGWNEIVTNAEKATSNISNTIESMEMTSNILDTISNYREASKTGGLFESQEYMRKAGLLSDNLVEASTLLKDISAVLPDISKADPYCNKDIFLLSKGLSGAKPKHISTPDKEVVSYGNDEGEWLSVTIDKDNASSYITFQGKKYNDAESLKNSLSKTIIPIQDVKDIVSPSKITPQYIEDKTGKKVDMDDFNSKMETYINSTIPEEYMDDYDIEDIGVLEESPRIKSAMLRLNCPTVGDLRDYMRQQMMGQIANETNLTQKEVDTGLLANIADGKDLSNPDIRNSVIKEISNSGASKGYISTLTSASTIIGAIDDLVKERKITSSIFTSLGYNDISYDENGNIKLAKSPRLTERESSTGTQSSSASYNQNYLVLDVTDSNSVDAFVKALVGEYNSKNTNNKIDIDVVYDMIDLSGYQYNPEESDKIIAEAKDKITKFVVDDNGNLLSNTTIKNNREEVTNTINSMLKAIKIDDVELNNIRGDVFGNNVTMYMKKGDNVTEFTFNTKTEGSFEKVFNDMINYYYNRKSHKANITGSLFSKNAKVNVPKGISVSDTPSNTPASSANIFDFGTSSNAAFSNF